MNMPAPLNLPTLKIEYVERTSLNPYAKNPRKHSAKQIKQLEESISQFGWTQPVLVGLDNIIVAGHGRVLAAANLGIGSIPIIRVGHLSAEQLRAYVIADNKLTENGEWDWDLLRSELAALDTSLMELTGFDQQEFEMLSGGNTSLDSAKSLYLEDALDTAAQRAQDKADRKAEEADAEEDADEPIEITCPHCQATFTID